MNTKKILFIFLLLLLVWKGTFPRQEIVTETKDKREFNLNFNREYPLKGLNESGIDIEIHLNEEAIKLGLTTNRIRNFTELRLRGEGIKIDLNAPTHFTIHVRVAGPAFSVSLSIEEFAFLFRESAEFLKSSAFSLTIFKAITWHSESFGTHGDNTEPILSSLGGIINEFLNDYYKANQKRS